MQCAAAPLPLTNLHLVKALSSWRLEIIMFTCHTWPTTCVLGYVKYILVYLFGELTEMSLVLCNTSVSPSNLCAKHMCVCSMQFACILVHVKVCVCVRLEMYIIIILEGASVTTFSEFYILFNFYM